MMCMYMYIYMHILWVTYLIDTARRRGKFAIFNNMSRVRCGTLPHLVNNMQDGVSTVTLESLSNAAIVPIRTPLIFFTVKFITAEHKRGKLSRENETKSTWKAMFYPHIE